MVEPNSFPDLSKRVAVLPGGVNAIGAGQQDLEGQTGSRSLESGRMLPLMP